MIFDDSVKKFLIFFSKINNFNRSRTTGDACEALVFFKPLLDVCFDDKISLRRTKAANRLPSIQGNFSFQLLSSTLVCFGFQLFLKNDNSFVEAPFLAQPTSCDVLNVLKISYL